MFFQMNIKGYVKFAEIFLNYYIMVPFFRRKLRAKSPLFSPSTAKVLQYLTLDLFN